MTDDDELERRRAMVITTVVYLAAFLIGAGLGMGIDAVIHGQ